MCSVIDFKNERVGASGKKYDRIESVREAIDVLGEDVVRNAFEADKYDCTFEDLAGDGGSCLCPFDTAKLVAPLEQFKDWKYDYQDFNP